MATVVHVFFNFHKKIITKEEGIVVDTFSH